MKALIAAAALIATPAASIAQYMYSQPTYSAPTYRPTPVTPRIPDYVTPYSNMLQQGRQQLDNSRMQRQIDANTRYRRQQQLRGY